MRFARLLRPLPLSSLVLVLLTACGGGRSARLEIELAPTFAAGSAMGDRQCRADARASLPRTVDCVRVSVCRRDGDECRPVRVLRASDDHGAARTTELRFSREAADNQIQFDVELAPDAEHELELLAYAEDGTPYARGRVEGIRAGQSLLRVRLEPYGEWACAGPRDDGSAPLARALHQAVALPNGDVLLIGGVTGESVQALSVEGGALLQRAVEVYDASDARFHEIAVADLDDAPGIGAVFHRARYLETTEGGLYRVRMIGGFTAREQPGARFDALQGLTEYSSPLLPGARAEVRDSIDLLYDPSTRALDVALVDPGAVRRAGMNAVSEPDAEGLVVVALGLLDGGGSALRPAPMVSGQWYSLPGVVMPGVVASNMLAPRFGHTASRLSEATVLVWGGNVTLTTIEDVAMRAGELLGAGAGAVPAGLSALPPATAFHTATPIEGGVLIAGGMEIAPVAAMSGGVSTTASTQPLTVIALDTASRVFGTPVAVDPTTWPTPSLHAATELPDGSVLVTGGAVRRMPAGTPSPSHLWASDAVLRVSRDATGVYSAEVLASMIGPRWGHAVARLPGDRVLVTGGFAREAGTLRAISAAETLLLATPPPPISGCGQDTDADGGATMRDAGARRIDASAPPDAAPPADAAGADAAMPATDAGL